VPAQVAAGLALVGFAAFARTLHFSASRRSARPRH
jgi:hypothetical protein